MRGWSTFYSRWRRVIFRIIREAMLPTCAAIAWGIFVGASKPSWIDGVSAAGIGFFFVLALQGQILRIAKNVRDEERGDQVLSRFDMLDRGYATMHETLTALQGQGLTTKEPASSSSVTANESKSDSRSDALEPTGWRWFFAQAEHLLEQKQNFPAVLMAAVGFENAVRTAAQSFGFDSGRRSIGQILRQLAQEPVYQIDLGWLYTLNKTRNTFVHGANEAPAVSNKEARELINAFSTGTAYLEELSAPGRVWPKRYQEIEPIHSVISLD
jgi:hypothetical protein